MTARGPIHALACFGAAHKQTLVLPFLKGCVFSTRERAPETLWSQSLRCLPGAHHRRACWFLAHCELLALTTKCRAPSGFPFVFLPHVTLTALYSLTNLSVGWILTAVFQNSGRTLTICYVEADD